MAARKTTVSLADLQAQLATLADAIALAQPGSPDNPTKPVTRKPASRKQPSQRKPRNLPATCMSQAEALAILGYDAKPGDEDRPASGRALYSVNMHLGLTPAS